MSAISSSFSVMPASGESRPSPDIAAIQKKMAALIVGYSAALSPIAARPLLRVTLVEPTLAAKAFSLMRDNPIIRSVSFALAVSLVGIMICPFPPPLLTLFLTAGLVSLLVNVDLRLKGRQFFQGFGTTKQETGRELLILQLRNAEAISPDERWQLSRVVNNNREFRENLAGLIGALQGRRYIGEREAQECLKALEMPHFTVYDSVLRYLNFKVACQKIGVEETISLSQYLSPDQHTQEMMNDAEKAVLASYGVSHHLFTKWLVPLQELQSITNLAGLEEELHHFKTHFLEWIYEQRQGCGISKTDAECFHAAFDHLWIDLQSRTKPLSHEELAPAAKLKKRAWVIMCEGGGAHVTSLAAIRESLRQDRRYDWDVKAVNLVTMPEIKDSLDIIARVARAWHYEFCGEDCFNYLIRHDQRFLINMMIRLGNHFFPKYHSAIEGAVSKHLLQAREVGEGPDVVISNIPLFNGAIVTSVEKHQVPCLLAPADMKSNYYAKCVTSPAHPGLRVGLAYSHWSLLEGSDWQQARLRPGQLRILGFPLREAFLEEKSREEARASVKEYGIPADKKIITLRMGAQGSTAALQYVEEFMKSTLSDWHMVVLCGKSTELIEKIKTRFGRERVTAIGFTNKVADLLRISDADLTKTGSASVAESWMLAPVTLLDPPGIQGEVHNVALTTEMQFGLKVREPRDLPRAIARISTRVLLDRSRQQQIKRDFSYFGRRLRQTMHELVVGGY